MTLKAAFIVFKDTSLKPVNSDVSNYACEKKTERMRKET